MNLYLPKLTSVLESRHGIRSDELREALFLLRAHYNLAGLVICCRRLVELVDRFEWLRAAPAIDGYRNLLRVVRAIAGLKDVDPHFLAAKTGQNKKKETPLRPYSGDSGLCDLLLIAPGGEASEQQHAHYSWMQAWFAAQVIQHQARAHHRDEYFAYLDQKEKTRRSNKPGEEKQSDEMSRLVHDLGSRVCGAMRFLRLLGDPEYAELAGEVVGLLKNTALKDTPKLVDLLAASLKKRTRIDAGVVALRFGIPAGEASARIAHVRDLDKRLSQRKSDEGVGDLRLLSRFLEAVWRGKRPASTKASSGASSRVRNRQRRLDLERYGELQARPQRIEGGIAGGGILTDLWAREGRPDDEDGEDRDPAHQDADEGPVEPELQIFVGDGDPVGAYYAAKSASHHIEIENALLRWPRWRLSKCGVDAVIGLIAWTAGDESVTGWARLLIAMSLVTGRRLPEAHVELVAEGLPPEDKLAITVADKVLHIPAARPELKKPHFSPDPLPEFCAPWTSTLRLPLPRAWHPLIEQLARDSRVMHYRAEREAERLLESLPSELAVSGKAVAHALKLALLEAGRDDLALVKVITDASEANTGNLIHYASYPRSEVESLWHVIVSSWAGPLGEVALPMRERERVGSPFGIEIEKVARAIAELKAEYRAALKTESWAEAHTLLVFYLSLWLGLGTAGRGTRHPIPPLITTTGWALVRDKHRADASTDRLLPLTGGVRAQIEVVRGLTGAFSALDPGFAVLDPNVPEQLALKVFVEGKPVAFRPSHWRVVSAIEALPRNWGRRLIRSESPELLGRFKDVGLGHWVRGRHPWSWTSTFPAKDFAHDWLAMQGRLEAALGFEVLEVSELSDSKSRPPTPLHWRGGSRVEEASDSSAEATLDDETIRALLKQCSRRGEYEAVFETAPPDPDAARKLLMEAIAVRHKMAKVKRGGSAPLPVAEAEAVAAYIRRQSKCFISANPPRSRFQRNWLVDDDAFSDWLRVEREILPAIEKDLRSLPPKEDSQGLRIGRLIAAVALRAGLLDTQHIDALFMRLASEGGIEAVGEARLMELSVRSKRTVLPMRRTVFLEPFLFILLTTERDVLGEDTRIRREGLDRHRYNEWNRHFRTYLRGLKLVDIPTLPRFLAALRQKLMIEASPILAAYASGELFTFDLPASEFRRLAGYEIRPSAFPDDYFNDDHRHDDAKCEEEVLPKDLQPASTNLAQKFSSRESEDLWEWIYLTEADLSGLKAPKERLLGHFALSLLQRRADAQRDGGGRKDWEEFKLELRRNLIVVWAALAQLPDDAEALDPLGAGTLRRLMDLTIEHFSTRRHRAAWLRFRAFLQSEHAAAAGIAIELENEPADEFVSAKILSRDEMDRIEALLGSVQSGIGTAANRLAAQGHFALTRDIGARRSETELLRQVDVDGELMRIQEYEGRTLKTKASSRVVPIQLLAAELRARVAQRSSEPKVIDAIAGMRVSGANFYDRVSKAMKEATGDPDLGLHHLRHSKASLMLLRMLDNVVPLEKLDEELPWLASSLPSREEAKVLLGSAGQAGQGMKVVAALLGHLHETTTLHHYVHTLCIAMHAHVLALPRIPIPGAFRRRHPIGANLYRHQREYESLGLSPQRLDYRMRRAIEAHEEKTIRRVASLTEKKPLVRKSPPKRPIHAGIAGSRFGLEANAMLDRWIRIEAYLGEGRGVPPDQIEDIRSGLRDLAAIPSGKIGSMLRRHPLPGLGLDGTQLPQTLLAGLPLTYATSLIGWLTRLHRDHRADFDWLMDRWLHASHSVSGAIRLTRPGDYERAMALVRDEAVRIEITEIHQTKSRLRHETKPRYQMIIKLGAKAKKSAQDGEGRQGSRRSAGAVRWVMTWAAVAFEVCLDPAD